ncbi:hypothetical protein MVEN_00067300 [Mycena venus]|uniref:DUF6535 domain-containing protein n=1 Tax=Mycena venus TaxID=2733690 RepID=A0A8H6Z3U6_9AGAR|nr:hypothetical protein MVEN_00067300 [Mycena venus]
MCMTLVCVRRKTKIFESAYHEEQRKTDIWMDTDVRHIRGRQDAGGTCCEGPFGHLCVSMAPIWKLYMNRLRNSASYLAATFNNDLDLLFIFVSAAHLHLSASDINLGLQEDLRMITNELLVNLLDSGRTLMRYSRSTPSGASAAMRRVNRLGFSSLMFSLTSELGVSLAKGWVTILVRRVRLQLGRCSIAF